MSVARVEGIAQRTPNPAQDSRPHSDNVDADFEQHLGMHVAMRAAARPGVAQGVVLGLVGGSNQGIEPREWRAIAGQRQSGIKGLTDLAVEEMATRGEPGPTESREPGAERVRGDGAGRNERSAEPRTDTGRAAIDTPPRGQVRAESQSPTGTSATRGPAHATAPSHVASSSVESGHSPVNTAAGATAGASAQSATASTPARGEAGMRIMAPGGASAARVGAVSAPSRVESSVWRTSSSPARSSHGQSDAEAVARQVNRGMAGLLTRGGGHVTLRLTPESLGTVHVRVEMRDGIVRAKIEASSESARRLLTEGVGSLKSALEARGLSVDRLEVAQRPGTAMHDPVRGSPEPSASQAGREPGSERGGDESASERRQGLEHASEKRGTPSEAASEKRGPQEDAASEKRGTPEESASEKRGSRGEARHADGSAKRGDRSEAWDPVDLIAAGAPRGIWRAEASLDSSVVTLRLDAVA